MNTKWIFPILTVAITALLLTSPRKGFAIGVEVSGGVTQQFPSGYLSYKGVGLDIRNDLKYDRATMPIARVKLDMPLVLPNIYLTAAPLRFSGQGSKDIQFQFGNVAAFSANVPYDTDFQLDSYDATLFYGVPMLETATMDKVKVEFGINVRILDFKASISQTQTGLSQSKSLTAAVPMGFFYFQLNPIEKIGIEGEVKGIAYGGSRYYNLTGRVKYRIVKLLFVAAGYKFDNLRIDQSDVRTDLMFGGPQLEFGLDF